MRAVPAIAKARTAERSATAGMWFQTSAAMKKRAASIHRTTASADPTLGLLGMVWAPAMDADYVRQCRVKGSANEG